MISTIRNHTSEFFVNAYQLLSLFLFGYFAPFALSLWYCNTKVTSGALWGAAVLLASDFIWRFIVGTLFVVIPWLWFFPVSA